jgi:hypothetical protein
MHPLCSQQPTLYVQDVYKIYWDNLPDDSLYSKHLDTLFDSSTKLVRLDKIYKGMQVRSVKAVANGKFNEKIVCATLHPAALGPLYKYFKVHRQDFKDVNDFSFYSCS